MSLYSCTKEEGEGGRSSITGTVHITDITGGNQGEYDAPDYDVYIIYGDGNNIYDDKMKTNYEGGNYGYGHAKQELFELICEKFSKEREQYNYYMENLKELDEQLKIGADKARLVAQDVLQRVREKLGY